MKHIFISLGLLIAFCSCATTRPIADYAAFYQLQPKTILVLPVANETTSAEAPTAFQSTIGSPLMQRGYYVFPVLPTIEIMRAEGIYEGEQLAGVAPQRFKELLGADAVLYITLHSWDTTYLVFASGVTVSMTYELVDSETGQTLWKDNATRTIQSDSSGSLLAAVINAAVTALATEYVDLARQANAMALVSLPAGPLHERYEDDRARYMEMAAKETEKRD